MDGLFSTRYTIDSNGCWLWSGSITTHGYAQIWHQGKPVRAHRLSWALHRGDLPVGVQVLHRCDVRHCVNPDHLFLGDGADNMKDKQVKGRAAMKLTPEQVIEIRKLQGTLGNRKVAKLFGIADTTVKHIWARRIWAHVDG